MDCPSWEIACTHVEIRVYVYVYFLLDEFRVWWAGGQRHAQFSLKSVTEDLMVSAANEKRSLKLP